jgi:hypothetical protein
MELPGHVTLVPYVDEVVEGLGFGPDHLYVESVIAALAGPSTWLLWKRLSRTVIAAGDVPATIDMADTLACLGLRGLGPNTTAARTVARMVALDYARRAGRDGAILAVRRALAPLGARQVARLPGGARQYHEMVMGAGR